MLSLDTLGLYYFLEILDKLNAISAGLYVGVVISQIDCVFLFLFPNCPPFEVQAHW